MKSTRRRFMQTTGTAALGLAGVPAQVLSAATPAAPAPAAQPAPPPAAAPPQAKPTLVAVYLRGGIDALSVLVPFKDPHYAELRKNIAVPGPDAQAEKKALPLDGAFGFHPGLTALHAAYGRKQCAPVICVGSPHPTRSHFEAQDYMERAALGLPNYTEGWLNRYLQATRTANDAPLRAIAFQTLLARSMRGTYPVLAMPPQQTSDRATTMFQSMYAGGAATAGEPSAAERIRRTGDTTIVQLQRLQQALAHNDGSTVKYPETGFGHQMRSIAKVVKSGAGLEVTAVDYYAWDTHADQGTVDGHFARGVGEFNQVLDAFQQDLGPAADRVLVLVMSEFGRTVAENGTRGTDHGRGGMMLALGRMVEGGKVFGRFDGLDAKNLYEQRDLPVHTDFRAVFAETLAKLYGFDAIKAGYFPQYTPAQPPLEFLRPV